MSDRVDELALVHPWNLVAVWLDQGAVYVRLGGEWRIMGEQMMACARKLEQGLMMHGIDRYAGTARFEEPQAADAVARSAPS